jgi:type I restriction enzyme, S subunit
MTAPTVQGMPVPVGWVALLLKHVCIVRDCKHVTAEFVDDGFPVASIREVQSRYVNLSTAKQTTASYYMQLVEGGRRPGSGDLLFSRNATVGEVAQVPCNTPPFAMGQDVCLLRPAPHRLNSAFAWYALRSGLAQTQIALAMIGSTFKRVNVEQIRNLSIVLPPLEQQKLLVEFLDLETIKIDAMISKQEQLIATLREDRTATITQAVTKGLEPNIETRESGVEWLGWIPNRWTALRVKNVIQSTESGTSVNAADWPAGAEEVGVLKTSCVSAGWFNPAANKTVVERGEIDRVTCSVRADSLIVNRANTPLLVGSAGYAASDYKNLFLSDKLWQVRFDGALAQFVHYWTQTETYRSQIVAMCVGASSSMQNLSMADFRNIALALPPVDEQGGIVSFLSDRTAKIDGLINKSNQVIEALREYRSAIITDAVTGKIDVRDAVA